MRLGSAWFYYWQFVKSKFNSEVKLSLCEMHKDSSSDFFKDEKDAGYLKNQSLDLTIHKLVYFAAESDFEIINDVHVRHYYAKTFLK